VTKKKGEERKRSRRRERKIVTAYDFGFMVHNHTVLAFLSLPFFGMAGIFICYFFFYVVSTNT